MNEIERAIWEQCDLFGDQVSDALKMLLETKHLYQSVRIDFRDIEVDLSGIRQDARDSLKRILQALPGKPWSAIDRSNHSPMLPANGSIQFQTPDAKLRCSVCKRVEAFNSISTREMSDREARAETSRSGGSIVQDFALSSECQSCKGPHSVFLVRRRGARLTIAGRAPIERIEVPAFIPQDLESWFSGAIVAHQSGQTLAGLFLLRTLVEQWVRTAIGQEGSGLADLALEAYMHSLPDDFKARFPSLRDVYTRISADLHGAIGSEELFAECLADIERHFEARRVFKL